MTLYDRIIDMGKKRGETAEGPWYSAHNTFATTGKSNLPKQKQHHTDNRQNRKKRLYREISNHFQPESGKHEPMA